LFALAEVVESGTLALDQLDDLPDRNLSAKLAQVPGIGPWTVQMFLMFRLRRQDVLPVGDIGVRRGLQLATDYTA